MDSKTFPFRMASGAGHFSCLDGEIESVVNARLLPISGGDYAIAYPDHAGDSDEWGSAGGTDDSGDAAAGIKSGLSWLNHLSANLLPKVEFSLREVALQGWQNHPDNPAGITMEAPKTKDMEGWTQRAQEALRSFHSEVARRNLFVEPFFAMCALRLRDGKHICPSSPVLLTPNKEAPSVEGADSLDLDSMTMKIRATCSRLRCRISAPQGLAHWQDTIEALDIFVSPSIPLYHRQEGLRPYHRAPGSLSPQSWLPTALSDEEFTAALLSTVTFRPVAAIPLDKLYGEAVAGFHDVDFNVPDLSLFNNLPEVKGMMSYTPDFMQLHGIEASAERVISGRTVLNGLTLTLPVPPSPETLVAANESAASGEPGMSEGAAGETASGLSPARVALQVDSVKNGTTLHAYRYQYCSLGTAFSETDFPKWIFIPDADARQLTIVTTESTYIVPLRRHPLLDGSFYWAGSLSSGEISETGVKKLSTVIGTIPDNPVHCDSFEMPEAVWVSEKENPYCLPSHLLMRLDVGRVIAVCRAFRASGLVATTSPTAYLFTDQGIFLVKMMDDGELRDAGLIARYVLASPESITLSGRALSFTDVDGRRLYISGTTVKPLSGNAQGGGSGSGVVMIQAEDESQPVEIITRPLKLATFLPKYETAVGYAANDSHGLTRYGGYVIRQASYGLYGSIGELQERMMELRIIGGYTGNLKLCFYGSNDLMNWQPISSGDYGHMIIYAPPGLCYGRCVISGCFSGSLEALEVGYFTNAARRS